MDDYLAAVGRDVGRVDTDAGGLARYSLKLHLPSGIHYDTVPELSLEYCQGTANGSLGVGWALGGMSAIRSVPSNLAFDGVNPPPAGYDVSKAKLALDGAELFNIQGDYDSPEARYVIEVDNDDKLVTPVGQGFVVRNSFGGRSEYGTTEDSRVWIVAQKTIREWRLARTIDYHGNTVTYTYIAAPQPSDSNACYISSIRYTSNEKTGFQGKRVVRFDYSSRPDPVIQTVQGDKCVWASRLAAIRIGVLDGDDFKLARSYELTYTISEYSGDSCLTSITETSSDGPNKVSLMPSTFGYMKQLDPGQDLFKVSPRISELPGTVNNVALFTMNISGRCLADLACIRYDRNTKKLTVKTYLASRNSDGTIGWQASRTPEGEATLQSLEIKGAFPNILTPDVNNDGRSDFIIPFRNPSDDHLRFSISQSVGTGFKPATHKATDFKWTEGSQFMTLDIPGGGVSIVQIFTNISNRLAFRSFLGVTDKGQIGLKDAVPSSTKYENVGTIDWAQIAQAGTGAKSLVRIWSESIGPGRQNIKATAFEMNSGGGFEERGTSMLVDLVSGANAKFSVLACDINADGTQDLVLATAQHLANKMVLTYHTFLGDGKGSFFKHGNSIEKRLDAPSPLNSTEPGQFYNTNINGTNYPTIAFVYQEKNTKAYRCLAVDGHSDGFIRDVNSFSLTSKTLPFENADMLATDVNGNGMGDWLFYTLDRDLPRLLTVYNQSRVADFLSWAQDPMGLRTNLKYGCLSDGEVYKSVDWKQFQNDDNNSYPVLAAPNYVVTDLEHQNDSSVNSIDYRIAIKKTYARARSNYRGRGWLGFEEISTLNTTDGILTTEKYLQTWPLAGNKIQIDTKHTNGETVKSVSTSYKDSSKQKGPWRTFRVDRQSERMDTIENGLVLRSQNIDYEHDEYGNRTLQARSETQRGNIMFQSWKRCTYTTIDGVTNFLTNQKFSSNENNVDMSKFESGDVSLTINKSEKDRAALKSVLTWSTDIGDFTQKNYEFDIYGREAQSMDAAGLTRSKTYDEMFQTYTVKVSEVGNGVDSSVYSAYDTVSGVEIARQEADGYLTCHRTDGFGRVRETRTRAVEQGPSTVKGSDFFAGSPYSTHPSFAGVLSSIDLNPRKRLEYGKQKSPGGLPFIFARATLFSKEGIHGQLEMTEYLDCIKQSCRKSFRDANDDDKIWTYREFDSHGNHLFESFPTKVSSTIDLDWIPDRNFGVRSTYDILRRPVTQIRPAHGQKRSFILTLTTHKDGGALIKEKTLATADANSPLVNATLLAVLERRYIEVDKDGEKMNLLVENIDENKLRSTYKYDIKGNLIKSTDPSNQIEQRYYNTHGDLIALDDPYRNMNQDSRGGVPPLSYKYDASCQLISQRNALGEVITYQRDAKDRIKMKIGQDGRAIKYEYDLEGIESLSSVTIYPAGVEKPFESKFEYKHDSQGRVKERVLTLSDQSTYKTSISYDWQDNVIEKVQPDGVVISHVYRGSNILTSSLSDKSASTWTLKVENTKHNPYGRPEILKIQGSGMKEEFLHSWEYDSQGFPAAHRLSTASKILVQEHYIYNDLDQLEQKHDFISGSTTDYKYQGKRLASSQSGTGSTNSYSYDEAGNLTYKRGTEISYSKGRATGVKDGSTHFDIHYDGAGRMTQRTTERSALSFSYDSLGALKSFNDSKTEVSIDFVADHKGETFLRNHADGCSELFIGDDLSITIQADGKRVVRHHLIQQSNMLDTKHVGHVVGTVTNVFESAETKRPLSGQRKLKIKYTDTKGNVVYVFNGEDAGMSDSEDEPEKLEYDEFGLMDTDVTMDLQDTAPTTYEGKYYDALSGLLNFGGRWYDPLIGRFTTPDNILDLDSLFRTDGMNRFVFENNDPINNIDPTGHWSWSSILGVVLSVVLVVAAIGVAIATGGAAAPLAGAIVGALASGGIAGIMYSVKHRDEEDAGKFWLGFGATVGANMLIGAVAGGLGAAAGPARVASGFSRMGIKALIGGTVSVLSKATERDIENTYYGKNYDLWEGSTENFLGGAMTAGAMSWISKGNPSGPGIKGIIKSAGKEILKSGFKLSAWSVSDLGVRPSYSEFIKIRDAKY